MCYCFSIVLIKIKITQLFLLLKSPQFFYIYLVIPSILVFHEELSVWLMRRWPISTNKTYKKLRSCDCTVVAYTKQTYNNYLFCYTNFSHLLSWPETSKLFKCQSVNLLKVYSAKLLNHQQTHLLSFRAAIKAKNKTKPLLC